MKRLLPTLLALTLILTASLAGAAPASAASPKPGDVIGYTLYSNVVAYIDGMPIPSYNIGGSVYVAVDDLAYYGFSVSWDGTQRTLEVGGGFSSIPGLNNPDYAPGIPSYTPVIHKQNMLGAKALPVLYTDIKCLLYNSRFDPTQVKTLNICSDTVIAFADLASAYAVSYAWDGKTSSTNLELPTEWIAGLPNPYIYNDINLTNGFSLTYENCSTDDTPDFELVSHTGDDPADMGMDIDSGTFSLSFYMGYAGPVPDTDNTWYFTLFNAYDALNDAVNISDSISPTGGRIAPDTPERRAALAEVYRVYINGEPVSGELAYHQGNGHYDYDLIFDHRVSLASIQTVTFELGYKQ